MKKTLVHIPHSSTAIPSEYRPRFMITPDDLDRELLRMTDLYTDELAEWPDRLVFPVSRLVCDVERFRDKRMESMTQKGMWVCYTHTSDGKQMKSVHPAHEDEILKRCYDPHHERLANMAQERIQAFGGCIIVDLHSFSPVPLPYEPNQDDDRPDICIGSDGFHTPDQLKGFAGRFFCDRGYTAAFDTPYGGAITPSNMYRREVRLLAIMIEMNRRLYMDTETGRKNAGFERLKDCMGEYLAAVDELFNEFQHLHPPHR